MPQCSIQFACIRFVVFLCVEDPIHLSANPEILSWGFLTLAILQTASGGIAMWIRRASDPSPNKDTLRTSRTTWKERKYEQGSTAETTECITAWRKPHGNVWPIRNLHLHPGITWLHHEFRGCEDYGIARTYRCTGQSYRYPFPQMGTDGKTSLGTDAVPVEHRYRYRKRHCSASRILVQV